MASLLNRVWSGLDFWDEEENRKQREQFAKQAKRPQSPVEVRPKPRQQVRAVEPKQSPYRKMGVNTSVTNLLSPTAQTQQVTPLDKAVSDSYGGGFSGIKNRVRDVIDANTEADYIKRRAQSGLTETRNQQRDRLRASQLEREKKEWRDKGAKTSQWGPTKALNTFIAGTGRGAAGVAQDVSGAIDLLTPGKGTSEMTKYFANRGKLYDEAAEGAKMNKGAYTVSQVPINLAAYATPGAAARIAGATPKGAVAAGKIANVASKLPGASKVAQASQYLDDVAANGGKVASVAAKAGRSYLTPSAVADIPMDVLQGAGHRTSLDQDNSAGSLALDTAMSVGTQGAFNVALQGVGGLVNKARNSLPTRPSPASNPAIEQARQQIRQAVPHRGEVAIFSDYQEALMGKVDPRVLNQVHRAARGVADRYGLDITSGSVVDINQRINDFIENGARPAQTVQPTTGLVQRAREAVAGRLTPLNEGGYVELPGGRKLTEEQYLAQNGAGFMEGSEPALQQNRISTKRGQSDAVNTVMDNMSQNNKRRAELRAEYQQKVANGEIQQPSRVETLIEKANSNPDNASTQAARRLLEKQGIDWKKPKSNPLESLKQEARKYKSAEEFVKAKTNQYHGTLNNNYKLDPNNRLFLTGDSDSASTYAGRRYNQDPEGKVIGYHAKDGKTLDLNDNATREKYVRDVLGQDKQLKKYYDRIPESLRKDYFDTLGWVMKEYEAGRIPKADLDKYTQAQKNYKNISSKDVYANWDKIIARAKKDGYDYIKHTTEDPSAEITFPETVALNPSKSLLDDKQLTDLYNQALKESQPKGKKTWKQINDEQMTERALQQEYERAKNATPLTETELRWVRDLSDRYIKKLQNSKSLEEAKKLNEEYMNATRQFEDGSRQASSAYNDMVYSVDDAYMAIKRQIKNVSQSEPTTTQIRATQPTKGAIPERAQKVAEHAKQKAREVYENTGDVAQAKAEHNRVIDKAIELKKSKGVILADGKTKGGQPVRKTLRGPGKSSVDLVDPEITRPIKNRPNVDSVASAESQGVQKVDEILPPPEVKDLPKFGKSKDKALNEAFEKASKQYLGEIKGSAVDRQATIAKLNKELPLDNKEALSAIVSIDDSSIKPINDKVAKYVKKYRELTDTAYQNYTSKGVKMGFVDDYLPRIYKNPTTGENITGAEFRLLTTGSARQRGREAINLSVENLAYKNPTELLNAYYKSLDNAVAGRNYLKNLEDNGMLTKSQTPVRGLRPIVAEGLQDPDGFTYYARPNVANKLNRMFGSQETSNLVEAVAEKGAGINSLFQSFVLSGGVPNTPINAFGIMQVIKEGMALHPVKAGKALHAGMSKGYADKVFNSKKDIIKMMAQHDIDLRVDLTQTGLTGRQRIANTDGALNKINQAWNEFTNDSTFGRFMPMLEVLHFENVYKKAFRKYGHERAAEIAADSVKNFYGKTGNYKQTVRSKVGQDAVGTFLFAPRFRESMLNFWGKNAKAAIPTNWGKAEYRDNQKFLIASVLTGVAMEALNHALNGVGMEDNPDGKKDKLIIPSGKVKQFTGIDTKGKDVAIPFLPSLATVPRNAASAAYNFATGKDEEGWKNVKSFASMPVSTVMDIVTNEDYFGNKITTDDASPGQKRIQQLTYGVAKNMQPWIREGLNAVGQNLSKDTKKTFGIKEKSAFEALSNAGELPLRFYKPEHYRYGDSWVPKGKEGQTFTMAEQKQRAKLKKEMDSIPDTLGLSKKQKAEYEALNKVEFGEDGEIKQENNPFYRAQRATKLQDDGVFEAMKKKAEYNNKLNGKPIDPLYKLTPEQRRVVLWKKTLPAGTSDPTVKKLYDQDWYQQYTGEASKYYDENKTWSKSMGYKEIASDNTNPFPEPSKQLQAKLDYYYTLPSGTGQRSAMLRANPDILDYWAKKDAWTNGERLKVGLGELEDKKFTSGGGGRRGGGGRGKSAVSIPDLSKLISGTTAMSKLVASTGDDLKIKQTAYKNLLKAGTSKKQKKQLAKASSRKGKT